MRLRPRFSRLGRLQRDFDGPCDGLRVRTTALPIPDLLHRDGAFIFFWATSPKLYAPQGSRTQLSPNDVARALGARYSGRAFVWIKTKAKTTSPIIHREDDLHAS
jgi:hypothetical protein